MTIGERIKQRRKELDLSIEDVAKRLGKNRATVYRYESDDIMHLPVTVLEPLARVLNTTPAYLMGWDDVENKLLPPNITEDFVTFPVLGEIAAGFDMVATEDWSGETVDIPTRYLKGRRQDEFFVLTVKGNSMYPLFHDGDIVLILKQTTLNRSGDIGVVLYEDENATLKKVEFVNGEDWMRLVPLNPEFFPRLVEGADLERCRILGIPKLSIREFE
ncbi:MAG: helix-turn-helix domain-containing protein [Clostridia bacterium]|nr:helix-turn-helix domain-containing protein [Clostridia bacterium]